MDLSEILCCPICRSDLALRSGDFSCTDLSCVGSARRFPIVAGKPVLLDTENSLFDLNDVEAMTRAAPLERRRLKPGKLSHVYNFLLPSNPVAERNAAQFLDLLKERAANPRLLVVGGGTRGQGESSLSENHDIQRFAFDVFASENVDFVSDAHSIPVKSGVFDGVWIQAVLEHVLNPWSVVAEIHRVLAEGGVVYAETPFMQQVHEGAYDFFRVTHSAHRWLFRDFTEIASGQVGGPGTAAIWSLRYLGRAVTGSESVSRLIGAGLFWLRWLDRLGRERNRLDSASGVFFLGAKSQTPFDPKNLADYYGLSK